MQTQTSLARAISWIVLTVFTLEIGIGGSKYAFADEVLTQRCISAYGSIEGVAKAINAARSKGVIADGTATPVPLPKDKVSKDDLMTKYAKVLFPESPNEVTYIVPRDPTLQRGTLGLLKKGGNTNSVLIPKGLQVYLNNRAKADSATLDDLQKQIDSIMLELKDPVSQTEISQFKEQIAIEASPEKGFKVWTDLLVKSAMSTLSVIEEGLTIDSVLTELNVMLAQGIMSGQWGLDVSNRIHEAAREIFMASVRSTITPISDQTISDLNEIGDPKLSFKIKELQEVNDQLKGQLALQGKLKDVSAAVYDLLQGRTHPDGTDARPPGDPMLEIVPRDNGELFPQTIERLMAQFRSDGALWYFILKENIPVPNEEAAYKEFVANWSLELPMIVYNVALRQARLNSGQLSSSIESKRAELDFLLKLREVRNLERGATILDKIARTTMDWASKITATPLKIVSRGAKMGLVFLKLMDDTAFKSDKDDEKPPGGVVKQIPPFFGQSVTSRTVPMPWITDPKEGLPDHWPVMPPGMDIATAGSSSGGVTTWPTNPYDQAENGGITGQGFPSTDPNTPGAGTTPVPGSTPVGDTTTPTPSGQSSGGTTWGGTTPWNSYGSSYGFGQTGYPYFTDQPGGAATSPVIYSADAHGILMFALQKLEKQAGVIYDKGIEIQRAHAANPRADQSADLRSYRDDSIQLLNSTVGLVGALTNAFQAAGYTADDASATMAFNISSSPRLHAFLARDRSSVQGLKVLKAWLRVTDWRIENTKPEGTYTGAQRNGMMQAAQMATNPVRTRVQIFKKWAISIGILAAAFGSMSYFSTDRGQAFFHHLEKKNNIIWNVLMSDPKPEDTTKATPPVSAPDPTKTEPAKTDTGKATGSKPIGDVKPPTNPYDDGGWTQPWIYSPQK